MSSPTQKEMELNMINGGKSKLIPKQNGGKTGIDIKQKMAKVMKFVTKGR